MHETYTSWFSWRTDFEAVSVLKSVHLVSLQKEHFDFVIRMFMISDNLFNHVGTGQWRCKAVGVCYCKAVVRTSYHQALTEAWHFVLHRTFAIFSKEAGNSALIFNLTIILACGNDPSILGFPFTHLVMVFFFFSLRFVCHTSTKTPKDAEINIH